MKEKQLTLGILRPLLRGLPIIAVLVWLGIMAAKRYLNYTTPMFESTARIKLADTRDGVPNSNLFKDFDVFTSSNKIAAEVELLKSKVLVEKAIQHLDWQYTITRVGELRSTELYDQCPFVLNTSIENAKFFDHPFSLVVTGDSMLQVTTPSGQIVRGKMNHILNFEGGSLVVVRNDELLKQRPDMHINDTYSFVRHTPENVINKIIGDLDVMSVDKEIPVLRISLKSPVAQKSADIVNAIAAAYIADYVELKFKSADTAMDFLGKELSTMRDRLSASENNIEGYRNQKNIINIRQETETDLRKIADLKKQQASVQMNLLAIKDLNRYMDEGKDNFEALAPNFEAFTDLLSTELVKKMKELQRERRDLLTRYTPDNDKVKVVDDKIGDISGYMRESIHNTEHNLQIKYDDLNKTIREAEEVFIGLPTKEKAMTILERNFSLNEQIYRFLHEKRTEAEIARAATISFHRIISPAEVPNTPVSPNPALLKVLAAFLSFLFGVFGIYLVHFIKGRISEPAAIQKNSDTPLLAEVPFLQKSVQQSMFFRRWAVELDLMKMLGNGSVVSVNSFDRSEGKRFIAGHLAAALQAMGKRVVLVNADSSIMPERASGAVPTVVPPAMLGQKQFYANWIKELNSECDVVIIKNTAVNADPASLSMMAVATTNLFVLDSRRTRQKMVLQADLLKETLQLPAMHFVLNRAGYNPSLVSQVVSFTKRLLNKKAAA
jgi:uncharacterized protein involved in exopolysaccharide biosynthesis